MPNTTVIFHSADFDGIFCREIARMFLGDKEVTYIGWNFGDPPIPFPKVGDICYVMDLPVDKPFGLVLSDGVLRGDNQTEPRTDFAHIIWIDHHASAIASHPVNIPGYRIDGVAACRLAWQWFTIQEKEIVKVGLHPLMPSKDDFIDREVSEPLAVRLAGEYDVCDKRDLRAEKFQYGLGCVILCGSDWQSMLQLPETISPLETVDAGYAGFLNPDGTMDNPTVVGLLTKGDTAQFTLAQPA